MTERKTTQRQVNIQNLSSPLLVRSPNSHNSRSWPGRSQDLKSPFNSSMWWWKSSCMSNHLLCTRMSISRKLELQTKPGVSSRNSEMGRGPLNRCHNHCWTHTPWNCVNTWTLNSIITASYSKTIFNCIGNHQTGFQCFSVFYTPPSCEWEFTFLHMTVSSW